MSAEVLHSTELATLMHEAEELLEARIVCFVYTFRGDVLTFGFPGGWSDRAIRDVLSALGTASQDALKSL